MNGRAARTALGVLLGGAARARRAMSGRAVRIALVVILGGAAIVTAAGAQEDQPPASDGAAAAQAGPALLAQGQRLFAESCSSCHGDDLRGIPHRGPSLRGAGAAAADFYLRTGRMPLNDPQDQPLRSDPAFDDREIEALIAYVGSFGGPPVPRVQPDRGDVAEGMRLFTESCAGCHQVVGRGGIATQGLAPPLTGAAPVDVAEAVRIGPYVMPRFPQLSRRQVDSLARYVEYAKRPEDRGGWGIGHIGPIPEGMVAWLLAGAALVLTIRLLGERTPT